MKNEIIDMFEDAKAQAKFYEKRREGFEVDSFEFNLARTSAAYWRGQRDALNNALAFLDVPTFNFKF